MSAMPNAMVLAAGLGKRMRPLTDGIPKPLVPVAGVALIDRALDWLAVSGVKEVVVNTHYKAQMLESHLAARQRSPRIRLSHEETLLETGGGIKKALPLLGDIFFSLNSDALCIDGSAPALHRLLAQWDEHAMDALLLLVPLESASGYDGAGDFFIETNGLLKRRGDQPRAPLVFTGIQLMHRRLFDGAPEGPFSLNLLYDCNLPRIRALVHDGSWLHIGDPAGLEKAEAFFR